MNLEAPLWIADFRFSAALDIYIFMFFLAVFPGLWGGVVFYFLTFSEFFLVGGYCSVCPSLLGWVGDGFCVSCPSHPPPLRVGAGLGNRVTHLWHRPRFRSCGLGLGGFCVFRVTFFLILPVPPARELGGPVG